MARRTNTIEPKWLLVFIFFISGAFFGGLAIYLYLYQSSPPAVQVHFPKGTFNYINPTIATEQNIDSNFSSVSNDLQVKIAGIIADAVKQGSLTNSSVYFKDFASSKVLAMNANATFSPGKLLKIPIMIAYYKLADQNPELLKNVVHVQASITSNQDIFDRNNILTSGDYTIDELITKMMVDNSDEAANVLFDTIDKNVLNEVFSDLGIDFTEDKSVPDFISIRRFSLFMRALYNATYLSTAYSEKALALLASDPTPSLLEANLPHAIPFAERVGGRRTIVRGVNGFEVYECDIVYYPSHNYMLCASAQSRKLEDSKVFFSKIGDAIYSDVHYQYGS